MEDKYLRWSPLRYFLNEEHIPKGPNIWNDILNARDAAKRKAKWKVGDGNDIIFWQENWLIQGPLINSPSFDGWANACIHNFGTKVSDYRSGKEWQDLIAIFKDLKPLMTILQSVILNNDQDKLVWEKTSSGISSVASWYQALMKTYSIPL